MSSTILACSFLDNFILLFFFLDACLYLTEREKLWVGGGEDLVGVGEGKP